MGLLNKLVLAIFVSVAMFATAPVAIAGKIKNATAAEVKEAIDDTIKNAEATLTVVQNGGEKDQVIGAFNATKQTSKRIESNVVDRLRSKANGRLNKARAAYLKGDLEKSEALLAEAIQIYKDVKTKYYAF